MSVIFCKAVRLDVEKYVSYRSIYIYESYMNAFMNYMSIKEFEEMYKKECTFVLLDLWTKSLIIYVRLH